MVFGGAPLGALAGCDFKLPGWLKSPFSLGASAAGGSTQKRFVMLVGTYKHAPAQDAAFRAKLRDMLMTF